MWRSCYGRSKAVSSPVDTTTPCSFLKGASNTEKYHQRIHYEQMSTGKQKYISM